MSPRKEKAQTINLQPAQDLFQIQIQLPSQVKVHKPDKQDRCSEVLRNASHPLVTGLAYSALGCCGYNR
jgi:hypothetical protein